MSSLKLFNTSFVQSFTNQAKKLAYESEKTLSKNFTTHLAAIEKQLNANSVLKSSNLEEIEANATQTYGPS